MSTIVGDKKLGEIVEDMPEAMQFRAAALAAARLISLLEVPAPQVKAAESSFDLLEMARFITGESDTNGGRS